MTRPSLPQHGMNLGESAILLSRSIILKRVMCCDFGRLENSLPDTEPQTNKYPTIESPAEAQRRRVF